MKRNGKRISASLLATVIVLSMVVLMVPSVAAAPPVPSGTDGIYWLEPGSVTAPYGNTVTYDVWLNTTVEIFGGEFTIETDPDSECGELVPGSFVENTTVFTQGHAIYIDEKHLLDVGFLRAGYVVVPPGIYHLGNFSVLCNSSGSCGVISLSFNTVYPHSYITNTTGDKSVAGQNATFQCAGPINVDIRADNIAGNIFDVSSYSVNPGMITEDGITINNQTAMGAMVVYCQENGINVNITMGYYGEWLIQIGNNASDEYNWCYAVDEVVPGVGGAQYTLSDGEFVHWFNYMLNYYTVLTTLDKTSIYPGDDITATVTWRNTTGAYLLSGASVNVSDTAYMPGTSVGTTGADGNVTFEWSTPGTWYVYAEHPTYGSGIYNYPPVSFTCTATTFDTGKGTYPSIFGTHNGTITPNKDILADRIYTYPCEGTGGHTEFAMIWNETTGDCAVANWNGYIGDYHNIPFNTTLTLRKGVVYNYTIRTGSYPQIHHTNALPTANGWINCTGFVDANGRKCNDWIPAIKLFYE